MRSQAQIAEGDMEERPRHRLGRSVFILPSLFTVGNIFCGYYAIISTMHGNYDRAAEAIGVAIILDALDGKIARLTNSTSGFGLQLDSLADVISFGIAPSILAFFWGLQSVDYRLGWTAAFTFTICGAMRLARFNVQAGRFKHFVGLPIPAGGGTIAAIVYFFGAPVTGRISAGILVAAVFGLALLMISTFKYSSLKNLTLGRKSHFAVLIIALLVALIYSFSEWTLLVVALGYSLSGPVLRIYSLLQHRKRTPVEIHLPDTGEPH
ncbi:MAG: CDP-diacylglycerol--serine O-phosphatidyltransferase [Acidobacteriia bacterium]|nr:CDP-diacylglycerol--serine O-phosphatidyltransferase [Terriglobia bacterium]